MVTPDASELAAVFDKVVKIECTLDVDPRTALRELDKLLGTESASNDRALRSRILVRQARAYTFCSDIPRAQQALIEARQLVDNASESHITAAFICTSALNKVTTSKRRQAFSELETALKLLDVIGLNRATAKTYFDIYLASAFNRSRLCMLEESVECFMRAITTANIFGLSFNKIHILLELAYIYYQIGDYPRCLELASATKESTKEETLVTFATVLEALAHMSMRNFPVCLDLCYQIDRTGRAHPIAHTGATLIWCMAMIAQGEHQEVEPSLIDLQAFAETHDDQESLLQIRILLSQVARAQHAPKRGLELLEGCVAMAESLGALKLKHEVYLELAHVYADLDRLTDALECYHKIREINIEKHLALQASHVRTLIRNDIMQWLLNPPPMHKGTQKNPKEEFQPEASFLQTVLTNLSSATREFDGMPVASLESIQDSIRMRMAALKAGASTGEIANRHQAFAVGLTRLNSKLTPTEVKICRMIREDLSSKEIAYRLGTSIRTVDTHRTRIRKKLGLDNTANLRSFLEKI